MTTEQKCYQHAEHSEKSTDDADRRMLHSACRSQASLTDDRCPHLVGFCFLGGRIESHRAMAAVTRAVAGALSDPEIREMVLRDAEMWDRKADFEE